MTMSWCNQCDGGNGHTANCPTLGLRFEEPKPARSADLQDSAVVSTRKDEARGVPSCDPELAAIKLRRTKQGWVNSEWLDDLDALLRMVDELTIRNERMSRDIARQATYELEAKLAEAEKSNERLSGMVQTALQHNQTAIEHNERAIQSADSWKKRAEAAEARVRELELAIRSVHADKGVIR